MCASPCPNIEPQLCTLVDAPPTLKWVHEIKLDGYRIQARVEDGTCVLRSRKGLDWTHRFTEITAACAAMPNRIIDGEICAVDKKGLPSFSGLQAAAIAWSGRSSNWCASASHLIRAAPIILSAGRNPKSLVVVSSTSWANIWNTDSGSSG